MSDYTLPQLCDMVNAAVAKHDSYLRTNPEDTSAWTKTLAWIDVQFDELWSSDKSWVSQNVLRIVNEREGR